MNRRLGKLPAKHDPRTLRLARYVSPLLSPPNMVDYSDKVTDWGMMQNDVLGDCTCATAGHCIKQWTANSGKPVEIPDAEIVGAYSAITGYDPRDPNTDQGAVELEVLKYWRNNGIAGHRILGFAALEPRNEMQIKQAVWLFEGCYIGLSLPASCQDQAVWDVPAGGPHGEGLPGSWGGHAVNVVAYDSNGLTVITWGQRKRMTWAFWHAYCDEAYALLSQDMFDDDTKLAPSGFDIMALVNDLGKVGQIIETPTVVEPNPTGKKRLYIGIVTGLGTDYTQTKPADNWNMNAMAILIQAQYPDYEIKVARHGWDEAPPHPYSNDPSGLATYIKDEITAFAPDLVFIMAHSFGGAFLVFFLQWLFNWFCGPNKDQPPFQVIPIFYDPVTNPLRFGEGQCRGWWTPKVICKRVKAFFQQAGVLLGIKGEPIRADDGVENVDVTHWTDPTLGHIDFFNLVCLIKDARVIDQTLAFTKPSPI